MIVILTRVQTTEHAQIWWITILAHASLALKGGTVLSVSLFVIREYFSTSILCWCCLYWSWRVNKSVTKLKAFFKIFVGANLLVISTLKTFVQDKLQAVWLGLPSFAESSFPSPTVCTGGCPGGVRWRQAKFHCILKKLSYRFSISMIIEARFIVPLTDSPILHKILLLKTL